MCGTAFDTITVVKQIHSTSVQNTSEEISFSVAPNPSRGTISITGFLNSSIGTNEMMVNIIDMTGRVIYSDVLPLNNGEINSSINLNNNIANGIYIIRLRAGDISKVLRFSLER